MKSNKEIVQEMIIDNPKVQDAFHTITRGSKWKDDLYPEIIHIYLTMDNQSLNDIYNKGESQFRYLFVRITMNQLQSSTSPFYKRYREQQTKCMNIDIHDFFPSDSENHESIIEIEPYEYQIHEWDERYENIIFDIYEDIKWNLHWYDRKLFDLFVEKQNERGPVRRIAEETEIPEQSVGSSIRNTRDILKNEIQKRLKEREE